MKFEKWMIIVIVVIFVVVIYFRNCSEHYGQDASIRASSGWLAGPMYGSDPIQDFANQIEDNRRKIQNMRASRAASAQRPSGSCPSCMSTEEFEMSRQ